MDEARTEQAINIALNGHVAMRQVRTGALSDWKGCSAANAARNAVFAARLARHGMTGPAPIFEGERGFVAQVMGECALDLDGFGDPENGDYAILRSLTETSPTNGELHTAVWAAIDLKKKIGDPAAIEAIDIETTEFNLRVLADGKKWHPETRETADHSLPYNVARALLDGDINVGSYNADMLRDPRAAELMTRTSVSEDPVLTALFPRHLPNRVAITLASGERLSREVISGPGTPETPMTDEDFVRKFRKMAAGCLCEKAGQKVIAFARDLDRQDDYRALFGAMVDTREEADTNG